MEFHKFFARAARNEGRNQKMNNTYVSFCKLDSMRHYLCCVIEFTWVCKLLQLLFALNLCIFHYNVSDVSERSFICGS